MFIELRFLISLIFLPLLIFAQDYYKILELDKDATDKDIRSAYRQLSKKYHPDKNPNDEDAHHKFIEVGQAYEILSDPEKRQRYDQFGPEGVNGQNGGGPGGAGFHDPFDIFEQMFGGGGGMGGHGGNPFQQQRQRGQNVVARESTSLKNYYNGYVLKFSINLNDICDHCHGSGSNDGKSTKCPDCQGRGVTVQVIRMGMMTQQIQQVCGKCGGKGQIIKNPCKTCHGSKVVQKPKDFEIELPAGAPRKFVHAEHGAADKHPDYDSGDVYIEFTENDKDNMGYRRRGPHLYRTEVLNATEALYGGWERQLAFLDSSKIVTIKREPNKIIQNGETERIAGFGMPLGNGRKGFGDLFIDYVVVMPESLSGEELRMRDEL
ncbi:Scj1p NDAI_0E00870 [Naumovozyma dairenensis CBS 421]|uniref:J domain-containing protein n=1 Tax=Naumovozyma dairenensis (strain ATCC 10597 / BCRC 20456 / CBS 421 / NBRC 0211 / NRRL Y-12639) TaxID=1071378 RepID=G0WAY3_NAUDC|nr:hypothetical protein NDAI_0E00870 [Naumovozyma dairenensis CBS 421]CCD24903.1 hypothetical protein NDAI_0E00870 [Naumovozyma dairenensis CBS 421]